MHSSKPQNLDELKCKTENVFDIVNITDIVENLWFSFLSHYMKCTDNQGGHY